jgi:hypothetical protein
MRVRLQLPECRPLLAEQSAALRAGNVPGEDDGGPG